MSSIVHSHDHFFRKIFSNLTIAKQFFEAYLPESFQAVIDFESMTLSKKTFIDPQLRESIADLLFSVKLAGKSGYLYLLVEHQSRSDRWMPLRVLRYMTDIMQAHIQLKHHHCLPIVVPMVLYNGKKPYRDSCDLFDLFCDEKALAKQTLYQPFQLIDLNVIPDAEIRTHQWSGIMEFVMKHIYVRDILPVLRSIIRDLHELESAGSRNLVVSLLNYVMTHSSLKANDNQQQFFRLINERLSKPVGEEMMTIAELLRDEGREEGEKRKEQAVIAALMSEKVDLNIIARVVNLSPEALREQYQLKD